MPIIHCNCFGLPAKHTWPPLWNGFNISNCQAVLPKAFPSLWACKDSLLGSGRLLRKDFNSGIPTAIMEKEPRKATQNDCIWCHARSPYQIVRCSQGGKLSTVLLNRWGRVHDEPAQQKSSALAPDTGGTPQQPVHLSGRGREASTDDWTVIRRGELSR